MRTLQQIEQEEKELRAKYHAELGKLEKEKNEVISPILRERFEGKYWKYSNGMDCVYSYCKKVISEREAIFDYLGTVNSENTVIVKRNAEHELYLCERQITRARYIEALQDLKNKLEGF